VTKRTIAARFRGPAGLGNGGYVAGIMAAALGTQPAEVTLRRGWPLEAPVALAEEDGLVRARDAAGEVVAEARAATLALTPPAPPSAAEAEAATRWFLASPFSHSDGQCFVCGSAWPEGQGLRVFTGPVPGRPGLSAALWRPHAAFAGADGLVAPEFLWSALDCAGHFAHTLDNRPQRMLLGRITGQLLGQVAAEEPIIVLGWQLGREGRKRAAGTALFTLAGELRGLAEALWITPPPVAG